MEGTLTKSKNAFKKIWAFSLDLLFPKFCAGCAQEGAFLCRKCGGQIVILNFAVCPACKNKISIGAEGTLKICNRCRQKTKIKFLIAPVLYENSAVRELISVFKYSGVRPVEKIFADWLQATTKNFNLSQFLVVPVPLHKRRLRQRGFNQAEKLAKIAAKQKNLKLTQALKKVKMTKPQVGLKGEERRKNPIGAFVCQNPALVARQKILLVDDVFTTGTTAQECARVLKEAGAREIWALTIAR